MSLSEIPKPLKGFLAATEARDGQALLATVTKDAVLTDMGEDRHGRTRQGASDDLFQPATEPGPARLRRGVTS
jgi:hypothetical protein